MIEAEINSLEDDLRTIKSETVTQLESFQSQQNQVRAMKISFNKISQGPQFRFRAVLGDNALVDHFNLLVRR